jgi:hypothetical protein
VQESSQPSMHVHIQNKKIVNGIKVYKALLKLQATTLHLRYSNKQRYNVILRK